MMRHHDFLLAITALAFILLPLGGCRNPEASLYQGSRAPLQETAFIQLPLGAISAEGWLKETLLRQKDGATGHLDELYPLVMGPRNGWLGGDGDQWERGPYWIDGLLPLAYILKDSTLIAKTTPWIEWMLSSQKEDGYFGPDRDYGPEPGIQRNNCADWWPRMVVLKVLQQYYSATSDQRVIDLMTKYFRYQAAHLEEQPLDNWTFWARYRGGDNLQSVLWLYDITGDAFLLDLAKLIYKQTEPYTDHFLGRDRLSRIGTIHGVNLAQGFKTPMVYSLLDHDPKYKKATDAALSDLRRFQGYPTGMFSVDEQIHGNNPVQGTELCAIVEFMYSLESVYQICGDPKVADLIERIAFNALPAHTTDDYMTRQYFQQVNQISTAVHTSTFDCNHGHDICFGLLTGYPCCTSNMHQGWPKFTQNLWYATRDGGLAAAVYAPSSVRAKVNGGEAVISEKTRYPFGMTLEFTVDSLSTSEAFPLSLRIPSWSREWTLTLNGERIDAAKDNLDMVRISRCWSTGDVVRLELRPEVELSVWYQNSRAVERGPLVYAYNIPALEKRVENGLDGLSYREFTATAPWNYALLSCKEEDLPGRYELDDTALEKADGFPWNAENAPVRINTKAVRALTWEAYGGDAGPMPFSPGYGVAFSKEEVPLELIPYGCTILRITEFPMKGRHSADNYTPIYNLF